MLNHRRQLGVGAIGDVVFHHFVSGVGTACPDVDRFGQVGPAQSQSEGCPQESGSDDRNFP
jgi:hypothetical protein